MRCKTFFLIFLLLILGGCNKTPTVDSKPTPQTPLWIDDLTPTHASYLYGVGVASDKQSAIKVALANMLAQLSTTIESKMEVTQESENSYYHNTQAKNIISSRTRAFEIKNYEVIKTHRINYEKFAVMLVVDKAKLADDLIASLQTKIQNYKQELELIAKGNIIEQYNKQKEISDASATFTSDIEVIQSLKPAHNIKPYQEFIQREQKKYLVLKKSINFVVVSDAKASAFTHKIQNYLSVKGFRVLQSPTQNSITIRVSLNESIVNDSYVDIALFKVQMRTTHNSQSIATNTISLKERFIGSLQNTYENAALHLQKDIDSLGLQQVLGFHLNTD